ncbi:MAG TPA: hypothetical protein VFH47_01040 [Candidatus Thermoplasmatota archaeon]|nr:hypothetical protein [Candidatus Thermoplasmatota archaeon]
MTAGSLRTIVTAPAKEVYAVLSDFAHARSRILGRAPYVAYRVEEGGHGAGTRIRAAVAAPGGIREIRLDVTEPEPGRVLQERESPSGVVVRYTVDALTTSTTAVEADILPPPGGAQARVRWPQPHARQLRWPIFQGAGPARRVAGTRPRPPATRGAGPDERSHARLVLRLTRSRLRAEFGNLHEALLQGGPHAA